MTYLLFVYGTLRRGESHALPEERFRGAATVRGRLYPNGPYRGFVPDRDGDEVAGELFEVDDALLADLDEYEGPEYPRVILDVTNESGETVSAWVYIFRAAPSASSPLLP